ncbi:CBO0543 family protein [Pseudoneobacillus sp. C159]
MLGDFIYLYLLSDRYPMWSYNPQGYDRELGLTNSHISLSIMLIKYPATILVYLGKFPSQGAIKKILYISFWILFYGLNEMIDVKGNLIKYDNGWSLWWSILFNIAMFIILRIHHLRPPLAWALSILFVVFLWKVFEVPSTVFR